jgi:hypothetical protein
MARINFPEWGKWHGLVSYIDLDAQIILDAGNKNQKLHPFLADPRGFPKPWWVKLLAGIRGKIGITFVINYYLIDDEPGFGKIGPIPRTGKLSRYTLYWTIETTPQGDVKIGLPEHPGQSQTSSPLSITPAFTYSRDDPTAKDPFLQMDLVLSLPDDGKGQFSIGIPYTPVSYTPGVAAVGAATATVPLKIFFEVTDVLAPPTGTPGNYSEHTVFFEIGSAAIDKQVKQPDGFIWAQGQMLDDWVENLKTDSPDVFEALAEGLLPLRGEAHASKTLQGKNKDDPEVRAYNQTLSDQRRNAVVNRLKSHISMKLDTNFIQANGITGGQTEDENVAERRCKITILGADVDRALATMKKLQTSGAATP